MFKDNFERDFKRMDRTFNVLFYVIVTFIAIVFLAMVCFWVWAGTGIAKHGLKGVVEQVWNGPNPTSNSTSGVTIDIHVGPEKGINQP